MGGLEGKGFGFGHDNLKMFIIHSSGKVSHLYTAVFSKICLMAHHTLKLLNGPG